MSCDRHLQQTLCRLYLSREKCRASQPLARLGPQSRGQAVRNRLGYILLACSSAGVISEANGGGSACDHTAQGCVRWQPVAHVHITSCTGVTHCSPADRNEWSPVSVLSLCKRTLSQGRTDGTSHNWGGKHHAKRGKDGGGHRGISRAMEDVGLEQETYVCIVNIRATEFCKLMPAPLHHSSCSPLAGTAPG